MKEEKDGEERNEDTLTFTKSNRFRVEREHKREKVFNGSFNLI